MDDDDDLEPPVQGFYRDLLLLRTEEQEAAATATAAASGPGLDGSSRLSAPGTTGGGPPSGVGTTRRKCPKITEFIVDRAARVKSYFRRRHVPFRRAFDMDVQCGSRSFLLQVSEDVGECLYFGDDALVEKFAAADGGDQGLRLSFVNQLVQQEKSSWRAGRSKDVVSDATSKFLHDSRSKKRKKSRGGNAGGSRRNKAFSEYDHGVDDDDDDYAPTAKEKEKRQRERKREAHQRAADGDFLSNQSDRNKAFKSRKESLVSKVKETDSVCSTKSFLVILNHDTEAIYYHGSPGLVALFFTSGICRTDFGRDINVRMFDQDEMDQNLCSVPSCLVTRNTLSKWRLAAIDMFKFPSDIPFNLYPSPEADRDRWIAELDLNPETAGKVNVCSLHFREGQPTDEFPTPTELLNDKDDGPLEFRGSRKCKEEPPAEEAADIDAPTMPYSWLKTSSRNRNRLPAAASRASNQQQKHRSKSSHLSDHWRRRRSRTTGGLFLMRLLSWKNRSIIRCRLCPLRFVRTRPYFDHVRLAHLGLPEGSRAQQQPELKAENQGGYSKAEDEPFTTNSAPQSAAAASQSKTKESPPEPLVPQPPEPLPSAQIEPKELPGLLGALYPNYRTKTLNPRKKYVCAVCKESPAAGSSLSKHLNLAGLFLHMWETHEGLLCQYCLKLFRRPPELEAHLKDVHNVYKRYYSSQDRWEALSLRSPNNMGRVVQKGPPQKYLCICAYCGISVSPDDLETHRCQEGSEVWECPFCSHRFKAKDQLEVHTCSGSCDKMTWLHHQKTTNHLIKTSKLLKVLTGKDPASELDPHLYGADKAAVVNGKQLRTAALDAGGKPRPPADAKRKEGHQAADNGGHGFLAYRPPTKFAIGDRNILLKYSLVINNKKSAAGVETCGSALVLEDVPDTGSVYCGSKSKGFANLLKRDLKDAVLKRFDPTESAKKVPTRPTAAAAAATESDDGSAEESSKLQMLRAGPAVFVIQDPRDQLVSAPAAAPAGGRMGGPLTSENKENNNSFYSKATAVDDSVNASPSGGPPTIRITIPGAKSGLPKVNVLCSEDQQRPPPPPPPPATVKVVPETKAERVSRLRTEMDVSLGNLRSALDSFAAAASGSNVVDSNKAPGCLVCQQARRLTVDLIFLYLHLGRDHDVAQVEDVLKENPLYVSLPRLRQFLKDSRINELPFRYESEESCVWPSKAAGLKRAVVGEEVRPDVQKCFLPIGEMRYACCCCVQSGMETYNDLLTHLEAVHSSKVLTCQLCQNIFLNYGSFISHVCFGPVLPGSAAGQTAKAKFSCFACRRQDLQTFLEFQYHIRKQHNVCEICFTLWGSQEELHGHCLTHSQELMCMKCFLTFDDQNQFRKHLYYEHEAEHHPCSACRRKSWQHVYHFCIKQETNVCEICDRNFETLQQYRVHFRTHTGSNPYSCTVKNCGKAFISKHLLLKHRIRRHPDLRDSAEKMLEERRNRREMQKFGATCIDNLRLVEDILADIIKGSVMPSFSKTPGDDGADNAGSPESNPGPAAATGTSGEARVAAATANVAEVLKDNGDGRSMEEHYDPVDAAVRSIMGIEGMFNVSKSPVKVAAAPSPVHATMSSSSLLASPTLTSSSPVRTPVLPHMLQRIQLVSTTKGSTPVVIGIRKLPVVEAGDEVKGVVIHPAAAQAVDQQGSSSSSVNGIILQSPPRSQVPSDAPFKNAVPRGPSQPQVMGGIWNQDLMFVSSPSRTVGDPNKAGSTGVDDDDEEGLFPKRPGCKVMKPRYPVSQSGGMKSILPTVEAKKLPPENVPDRLHNGQAGLPAAVEETIATTAGVRTAALPAAGVVPSAGIGWDLLLSESSDESDADKPKAARIRERRTMQHRHHQDCRVSLADHDYCFHAFLLSQLPPEEPPKEQEDLSEMGKILSNVAMGSSIDTSFNNNDVVVKKKKRDKKRKKKRRRKSQQASGNDDDADSSSSDNDGTGGEETTGFKRAKKKKKRKRDEEAKKASLTAKRNKVFRRQRRPQYHASGSGSAQGGVAAGAARPHFTSSESEKSDHEGSFGSGNRSSCGGGGGDDLASSDLDTDFSADDVAIQKASKRAPKPSAKVTAAAENEDYLTTVTGEASDIKPALKLKIKLPPRPPAALPPPISTLSLAKSAKVGGGSSSKKRKRQSGGGGGGRGPPLKKRAFGVVGGVSSRFSNGAGHYDSSEGDLEIDDHGGAFVRFPSSSSSTGQMGGTGTTQLYCYCQSPHDEVSDMIGCDAPDCKLEWFHFKCVGIVVPPEGKWFCPDCAKRYRFVN